MPAPFVYPHDPKRPGCECRDCTTRQRASLAAAIIVAALALLILAVVAKAAEPRPIPAPPALIAAREACPINKPLKCRAELVRAYTALRWQRKARLTRQKYGVQHALRLASALYGVPLAQMRHVATCESGLDPLAKNTHSSATGLMQWLNTSWTSQGLPGFARTDPYASALAAGRAVKRDHGWSQWSCKPGRRP